MRKLLTAAMTSAIALTVLGGAGSVEAKDRQDRREDVREWRKEQREDRREWAKAQREERREFARYVRAQRRFDAPDWRAPRGYAYRPYRYGEALPYAYRAPAYAIHTPQDYYLDPAPYGHQWSRVGDDAVLSSLSSGLVLSVVQGLFY